MERFLNDFFINVSCVNYDHHPAEIQLNIDNWEGWLTKQFQETGIVWIKKFSKKPKSLINETGRITNIYLL